MSNQKFDPVAASEDVISCYRKQHPKSTDSDEPVEVRLARAYLDTRDYCVEVGQHRLKAEQALHRLAIEHKQLEQQSWAFLDECRRLDECLKVERSFVAEVVGSIAGVLVNAVDDGADAATVAGRIDPLLKQLHQHHDKHRVRNEESFGRHHGMAIAAAREIAHELYRIANLVDQHPTLNELPELAQAGVTVGELLSMLKRAAQTLGERAQSAADEGAK